MTLEGRRKETAEREAGEGEEGEEGPQLRAQRSGTEKTKPLSPGCAQRAGIIGVHMRAGVQ